MVEKIVSSHVFECFGRDNENNEVVEDPTNVLVLIQEYGKTEVLCRYFQAGKCTASVEDGDNSTISKCIYSR